MNNFELIFKTAQSLEEPEKTRTLVWLWTTGLKLKNLYSPLEPGLAELDRTLAELKEFISQP